jgi:SepF-like predicted cell division protein (DUF552 family)
MGIQLPGELVSLLQILGYNFPKGDEQKLFEMGQTWLNFGNKLKEVSQNGQKVASQVWEQNKGANIDAFQKHYEADDGPTKVLDGISTGGQVVGAGMMICAGIILALKISTITQLVTLAIEIAQAIASAVATFGASLAEIPIFEQISQRIVGELIQQVINKLMEA